MRSKNFVQLLGHVGGDPETRRSETGEVFVTFSVATNSRWTDRSGTEHEETEWHDVICFGGLADLVAKFVKKGDPVLLEGRLRTRTWTDQAGMERRNTGIVARDVTFLARREDAAA
ncbi:MAG: single-stranded DNA-binding protein [Rhodospirillaceae bacterium]|nr:single-stranded DNA-binding protein [Rhodospirillaceae bacterium]MDE0417612.1 single-stranded DNA-binding protein [bacterium]